MAAGKKEPEGKSPDTSGTRHSLRDDAEEQLARTPTSSPGLDRQTPEQIIHELQVHQVELEIQAEELRKSKLALEDSRDKYLDLYDFAPLGYFTLTDKGLISDANLTGATLFGVERSRLVNARFSKFVADRDTDEWHWFFLNVLNQKEKRTCTLMLKRGGGPMFPAQLEAILTTGSDGVNTVRIAIIDITERNQSDEARRINEERLQMAQEIGHIGCWEYDIKTNLMWGSDEGCRIFGYPKKAGSFPIEAFTSCITERELVLKAFNDLVNEGKDYDLDFIINPKDGSAQRTIHSIGRLERDESGNPVKVTGTNQDITERKQAENALLQANKKLNLLSSITRHDINNQLMSVNGFLSLLHKKVPDPTLEDYFTRITKASDRIAAMIRFTKEYEEIGVKAPIWQDCRYLVDNAAKQAALGKVTMKNDLQNGMEVFADPLMVKVFYNLMDNAVRYGGKITTIRFSVKERGGDQILICEDDGDGVVADEKEKIFERGFGKNTGMGLFLSREILDITGILITETGEPGKGARFEMTVPKGAWQIERTGT